MSDAILEESRVPVAMIAAVSRNGVIGIDDRLPWYLPEDLKFFKRMTQGKPLVMGRKTFASIGRALPGRLNIVITRDTDFEAEGVRACHDLDEALALAGHQAIVDGVEEVMVMGGGEVYAQAMPRALRLYLTEVAVEIDGDARFPAIDRSLWQETQRVQGKEGGRQGRPAYDFVVYQRR